ncbi:alcohol dehydrogenase catalytic domain-containing protein [Mycetocola zhadangensis]|uniref:alcohol dehydrogenase catalytic domain-containing protein n=1 Tax=Mycetocola zhadangensis TaxID=1164595 RepID=UPI003A4E667D
MTRVLVEETGRDVLIRPSPVAMVWQGDEHPFEALAVPGVSLAPGDVLVEVELATVCERDVRVFLGQAGTTIPVVMGHEQVGRVVAAGERAVATDGTSLVAGMRVVWSRTINCGSCDRCSRGLTQACRSGASYGQDRVHRGWELSGGFASHVQVRAGSAIVRVDESLPAAVVAPAPCVTATVVAALEAAAERVSLSGSTVVVIGAGMRGITATAMATDAGARVVVCDPESARRSVALTFGAVAAADSRAGFRSATGVGGVLAALAASGTPEPLVVLDFLGSPAVLATAVDLVGPGGVIVLAGPALPAEGIRLDSHRLVHKGVTLRGISGSSPAHLEAAVEYLKRAWYRYPFADLVGETFPLSRVDDALASAATAKHPRVALDPRMP